jgi:tetratricopeptide (TPR) repeat protein
MNPPLTGRQPKALPENERRKRLRWRASDRKDPFAGDPNDTISELGRLVAHRPKKDDVSASDDQQFVVDAYFALGDLCALRALQDEELRVFYVGKVLIAYELAYQHSTHEVDHMQAENALGAFIQWVLDMAQVFPDERNIAVALWIGAYQSNVLQPQPPVAKRILNTLLMRYAPPLAQDDSETHFDADLPMQNRDNSLADTYSETHIKTQRDQHPQDDDETRITDDDLGSDVLSKFDILGDNLGLTSPQNKHPEPSIKPPLSTYQGTGKDDGVSNDPDEGTVFDNDSVIQSSEIFQSAEQPLNQEADENQAPAYHRPTHTKRKEGQNDFNVGERINGRYEVVDYRTGGMGIVYLCYDHEQNAPVAIKSFQKRFLNNERAVARFEQEAYAWIRLDKHPNIVQARLVQTIQERPHIILEHVSPSEGMGVDLRSWLDQNRLPLANALLFALQITWAMRHACEHIPGLVHRDLKPANILISHDKSVKVTDFGLVRSIETLSDTQLNQLDGYEQADGEPPDDALTLADDEPANRLTRDNAMVGTPPYMSPEQCLAQDVDKRADIYAFGIVLYEMLTGKHPFHARGMAAWRDAHLHSVPYFDEKSLHTVPSDVRDLVLQCLKKDPSARPQSWESLEDTLRRLYQKHVGEIPVIETHGQALEIRELMDKGYSLTELGRYPEALVAYDEALALQDDYAWAWARKGRTYRLLEQYDDALVCYDRALDIHPEYAWALAGKGIILDRIGDKENALIFFERATEANQDDVWYWYNRGSILQALGRDDEALKTLEQGLLLDSKHVSSLAKIGQIHRLAHRYEDAIQVYKQALHYDESYAWAWNGLGLAYKALGNHEEAIGCFRQASEHDPHTMWHWYNLADTLIVMGRYSDALPAAQESTRTAPDHAGSWAKLGQILRYLRQHESALEAYEQAIHLDEEFDWAYNGKGIVYEQMKRYDEALEAYQQATHYNSDSAWYRYNIAKVLMLLKRHDEALEYLQNTLEEHKDFARSWALLGKIHRDMGDYDDSLVACQKATRITPNYAWGWYELGTTLEYMKHHEQALVAYQQASHYAPHQVEYHYKQADMLTQLRLYDDALATLQRAIVIDNRRAYLWAKRGQILRKLVRMEEALTCYTRALNLDPEYSWAWSGYGLTLSALGKHQEALDSFKQALTLKDDDVWYWYNYAEELLIAQDEAGALEALDEAIALQPDHAESWAKYAQIMRTQGRFEESLQACDKAITTKPNYSWAWNGRGLTLRLMGRYEEALQAYTRAIELAPKMVWYYFNKLTALLDMGRREEALELMDDAVNIAPDNAVAWARHGQVLRRLNRYDEALESYDRALVLDNAYAWAWNGKGMCLGHNSAGMMLLSVSDVQCIIIPVMYGFGIIMAKHLRRPIRLKKLSMP